MFFFHDSGQALIRSFFLLLFPTRFIFFFILIPAEVTIEAHMFSEPFVLRCFTTETSYKQEKLFLLFSHFSFKKISRILQHESWFLTAEDQRSYKLKFKSYIQKTYRQDRRKGEVSERIKWKKRTTAREPKSRETSYTRILFVYNT